MDLSGFLTGMIFGYMLVLARIGTALIFMPGFGETHIPSRVKVLLVVAICIAMQPAVPVHAMEPSSLAVVVRLMAIEITIGLWIGLMARILMTSLQFAGYQVGMASALANAFAAGGGDYQGSTIIATFLLVTATALIFITDTHHIMIRALMYSYNTFPVGEYIAGDHAKQAVKVVHASLYIGISMATPFFVMSVLNNVGLGLANRMMPTLPVFFVASGLLVASGVLVLSFAAPSMLRFFFDQFTNWLMTFEI